MPHHHTVTKTTVDKYSSESTSSGSTPEELRNDAFAGPSLTTSEPFSSPTEQNRSPHVNVSFTANISQSQETQNRSNQEEKTKVSCTCCDKLMSFFGC